MPTEKQSLVCNKCGADLASYANIEKGGKSIVLCLAVDIRNARRPKPLRV